MGVSKNRLPTSYDPSPTLNHKNSDESLNGRSSQHSTLGSAHEKSYTSTLPFNKNLYLDPSSSTSEVQNQSRIRRKKRNRRVVIGCVVGLVVIGAAVGGVLGVLLSRHHDNSHADVSPLHYSSSAIAASMTFLTVPTSTSSIASASGQPSAAAPAPTVAAAVASDPLRRLVVFGASWCDNGHPRSSQYADSLRPPPYFGGRDSNGIVWDEYVANSIGSNGETAELVNYAYVGAMVDNNITVSSPLVPDLYAQIQSYLDDLRTGTLSAQAAGGKTLVAIWVGLNPIMALWNTATNNGKKGLNSQSETSANTKITATSTSLLRQISGLLSATGSETSILLLPLPPTEILPYARYWSKGSASYLNLFTNLTTTYNQQLEAGVTHLANSRLFTYDIPTFFQNMLNNPEEIAGVSNTTVACIKGTQVCDDVGTRLWWDSIHMTTKGHAAVAKALLPTVDTFWTT